MTKANAIKNCSMCFIPSHNIKHILHDHFTNVCICNTSDIYHMVPSVSNNNNLLWQTSLKKWDSFCLSQYHCHRKLHLFKFGNFVAISLSWGSKFALSYWVAPGRGGYSVPTGICICGCLLGWGVFSWNLV